MKFNAQSMAAMSYAYNRQRHRKQTLQVYRMIKQAIKKKSKKGGNTIEFYCRVYDFADFSAIRLFMRKHPEFTYRRWYDHQDVDHIKCDFNLDLKYHVRIMW